MSRLCWLLVFNSGERQKHEVGFEVDANTGQNNLQNNVFFLYLIKNVLMDMYFIMECIYDTP